MAARAWTPEVMSANGVPKCIGGPPSSPVNDIRPEYASALAPEPERHRQLPHQIAAPRLDAHDVGAEVSEQVGTQRARDHVAEVEDPESGVGTVRAHRSPPNTDPYWPRRSCFAILPTPVRGKSSTK